MAIAEYEYTQLGRAKPTSDEVLNGKLPDEIQLYLKDIAPYRKLGLETEVRLAQKLEADRARYEQSDKKTPFQSDAKDQLVLHSTGLVVALARKRMRSRKNGGLTLLDLIQIGNEKLVKRIDDFDYRKGRLATFTTWWVRAAMSRAANNNREFSVKQEVREVQIPQFVGEIERRQQGTGTILTHKKKVQLAAELFPSKKPSNQQDEAEALLRALSPVSSIDEPLRVDNNNVDPKNIIPDPNGDITFEEAHLGLLITTVEKAIDELPHPLPLVMKKRYGLNGGIQETLEHVAGTIGADIFRQGERHNKGKPVTRERVRQLEAEGLRYLRENENLRSYYGES